MSEDALESPYSFPTNLLPSFEKKSRFLLVFSKKPYICTEITIEFKTKTDAIERSIPFINKHLS